MAIGKSSLDKLYDLNGQISGSIGFCRVGTTDSCIYSTWNTFQYVASNLSVWADWKEKYRFDLRKAPSAI